MGSCFSGSQHPLPPPPPPSPPTSYATTERIHDPLDYYDIEIEAKQEQVHNLSHKLIMASSRLTECIVDRNYKIHAKGEYFLSDMLKFLKDNREDIEQCSYTARGMTFPSAKFLEDTSEDTKLCRYTGIEMRFQTPKIEQI